MKERRYPRITRLRRARLGLKPYTPVYAQAMGVFGAAARSRNLLIKRSIDLTQSLRRCVELETKLDECRQFIEATESPSGCCMCGSAEGQCDENHGFTDSGLYHSGQMVEQIKQLLDKGLRDHWHGKTVPELGQALNAREWENKKLRGLLDPMKAALSRWENGHAFDNHGADRELQRRLEQWRNQT